MSQNRTTGLALQLPGEPLLAVVKKDIYLGFGAYEHEAVVFHVAGAGSLSQLVVPLWSEVND